MLHMLPLLVLVLLPLLLYTLWPRFVCIAIVRKLCFVWSPLYLA